MQQSAHGNHVLIALYNTMSPRWGWGRGMPRCDRVDTLSCIISSRWDFLQIVTSCFFNSILTNTISSRTYVRWPKNICGFCFVTNKGVNLVWLTPLCIDM